MRAVVLPALLNLASCSTPASTDVNLNLSGSTLVEKVIAAAEMHDTTTFAKLTVKSKAFPDWQPPKWEDVDLRDEGCRVQDVDAVAAMMVLVHWICSGRTGAYLTERTFLIEGGRVFYMWDDWGGMTRAAALRQPFNAGS